MTNPESRSPADVRKIIRAAIQEHYVDEPGVQDLDDLADEIFKALVEAKALL